MDQYQKGSGPDAGKRPGHAQESREVIACLQQPPLATLLVIFPLLFAPFPC